MRAALKNPFKRRRRTRFFSPPVQFLPDCTAVGGGGERRQYQPLITLFLFIVFAVGGGGVAALLSVDCLRQR